MEHGQASVITLLDKALHWSIDRDQFDPHVRQLVQAG